MKQKQKKKVYLVGIKGVAMTSLAVYLKQKGYEVSGSDVSDVFSTDAVLKSEKIKVLKGFSPNNINKDFEFVVATGAHGGATNTEVLEAKKQSIPSYMHGRFLGKLMENKVGIAVAGCHGKTTTSSMIATIFQNAKLYPSYAIGTAYINGLGPAGHFGKGKYFLAEADEYVTCPITDKTPRFHYLYPKIAVVTNIEYDHPDVYKDFEGIKKAYIDFSGNLGNNGLLITSIDDPGVSGIFNKFKSSRMITYGFSPRADYRIEKFHQSEFASFMTIANKNLSVGEFMVNVPGKHNLANALAAIIVAIEIGIPYELIKESLKKYTGSNRRFEFIGKYKDVFLYDDYAHHPSEIKATLKAFRDRFPGRQLVVIFQPHTFSRTKELADLFAVSFSESDFTLIPDIFASARENNDPSISSSILVSKINKFKNNSLYVAGISESFKILKKRLLKKSIIVTLGAGNLNSWHPSIIRFLKNL